MRKQEFDETGKWCDPEPAGDPTGRMNPDGERLSVRPMGIARRLEQYLCQHFRLTKPWQHRSYDSGEKHGGGLELARPPWGERDTSDLRKLIADFFQDESLSGGQYKIATEANDGQYGLTVVDAQGNRWFIIMTAGDSYNITIIPYQTR